MANNNDINTKDIRYVRAYITDDVKAVDPDNHRINFIVSSEVVDRATEIVEAQAVFDGIHRKGEFEANPICLACHMHRLDNGMPPGIGYWDVTTAKLKGKHVEMVLQYDVEYDLGKQYWTVYKNKTMRAVSIGFRILDYRVEERSGTRVLIITKIELVEISCVAVGCNKQALSKLKELGLLPDVPDAVKSLTETLEKIIADRFASLRDELLLKLEDIESLLISDADDDLSMPDAKGIPSDIDEPQGGPVSDEQLLEAFKNAVTDLESTY